MKKGLNKRENSRPDLLINKSNLLKSKRSQITIFIIIAIVIVAIVLLLFFWNDIKANFVSVSPESYIQSCIKNEVGEAIKLVSERGGSINPENYFLSGGYKIEYLCYTNEFYKTCSIQQPMLKQHIQNEIENYVKAKSDSCLSGFKTEFEKRGYQVTTGNSNVNAELVPNNLKIDVEMPVTITKETTSVFNKFSYNFETNLYDFAMISSSILNWEARYGNSETTSYMTYYPNMKVEKITQEDGSKVYILTDRDSEQNFKFATRSLAWPAGLGYGELHTPLRT